MDLSITLGLGVVGNFAGHLEQAGEAKDFVAHKSKQKESPKGLFPFYIPGYKEKLLGSFPFSTDTIFFPPQPCKLQLEAEVALLFDVTYKETKVSNLTPRLFTVFNDCSIRANDGRKLSEKKNWGRGSKGLGEPWVAVDEFKKGGPLDSFSLIAFIKRERHLHQAIPLSPVVEYSYFHETLTHWMVDKLNTQAESPPLEAMPWVLEKAGYPATILVTIGATRYTDFGSSNYLQLGDEIIVALFNHKKIPESTLRDNLFLGQSSPDCILLHQRVVAPEEKNL